MLSSKLWQLDFTTRNQSPQTEFDGSDASLRTLIQLGDARDGSKPWLSALIVAIRRVCLKNI